MNPNAIALAAAVTAAAATDLIRRFKKSNTPTSPQTNRTIAEINLILMKELERQMAINGMLEHQNDYLSSLLDQHDVPVTEFDRIVMTYPITAEK